MRDHDHFTGEFLQPACNDCNLARRIKKPFLPVVFHNLRGYDMHHIIKHALGQFKHWQVQVIAQSSEKFQTLLVYIKGACGIRFIDSMQFLQASLCKLADMLDESQKTFTNSLSDLPLAARDGKGIFPYSFATSQDILEEERTSLPPKVAFHDALTDSLKISDDDYLRAQTI